MVRVVVPLAGRDLVVETAAAVRVVELPPARPAPPLGQLLDDALAAPIGSARLEERARRGDRVTVIVSDATRREPRRAFLDAVRARLPEVHLTLAIATGTHGPSGGLAALGLDGVTVDAVVDHDGHAGAGLVTVGTTARGTPVTVHRACVEADLVVATGVIRGHYFAGFGAGAKAIFPGLAAAPAARINHQWKADPRARAGAVDDNPCRLDLEEAAALAAPRGFLLDGVADRHDQLQAAVAGDVGAAFRHGAALAGTWLRAAARPSRCVVAVDTGPVTRSLYQASKAVAAVAPWLLDGGRVVLVAGCEDGIGPLDVVNHGIYQLGLRPRLPARHEIVLVSSLAPDAVAPSYARWAPDLATAIADADELLVVAGASKVIADVLP
ncbi:MAG: lactate racemase domain-containing protein [Kofleriaceae bacterium]